MMTLGVPGSGTTAVMLGALMILGMQPGPLLFEQHADVAWTVIASMFIGNIVCAIINLPLASLLVRILAVPTKILYPAIVAVAFIGAYTINFSVVDFVVLVVLGLFGYFMKEEVQGAYVADDSRGRRRSLYGAVLSPVDDARGQRPVDILPRHYLLGALLPDDILHRVALHQRLAQKAEGRGGVRGYNKKRLWGSLGFPVNLTEE